MHALGKHVISDLHGCSPVDLADTKRLKVKLLTAAISHGATVVKASAGCNADGSCFAQVIIAESHLIINAFPSTGLAFIDAFTCGDIDPEKIIEMLTKIIKHGASSGPELIPRGVFGDGNTHFPHKIT